MSQSPNQNQETEELHPVLETYEYFESGDTVTCNVGIIAFTLYSRVWMFASGTHAAILPVVLSESPDLCSAHSFIRSFSPNAHNLSVTTDASFFLEHKTEMVTHQFIAALCGMSCARKIYLYLQKQDRTNYVTLLWTLEIRRQKWNFSLAADH